MSYYHELIEKFSGCQVSVAFTNDADWRQAIAAPINRASSLMNAAEYVLARGDSLQFAVITAHTAKGDVDLSADEVEALIVLVQSLRDCQD